MSQFVGQRVHKRPRLCEIDSTSEAACGYDKNETLPGFYRRIGNRTRPSTGITGLTLGIDEFQIPSLGRPVCLAGIFDIHSGFFGWTFATRSLLLLYESL